MRAKGSTERFDLHEDLGGDEELKGATVVIQHVGPGLQRRWALAWKRLHHQEQLRLIKLRKGFTQEEAPYLWPSDPTELVTPEGEEEGMQVVYEIVKSAVVAVENWGPLQGCDDHEVITDELERIGVIGAVMQKCVEVQAVTPRQFPSSESAGDVRPRKGPTKKTRGRKNSNRSGARDANGAAIRDSVGSA